MKVYVLIESLYDDWTIYGVVSSLEAAEAWAGDRVDRFFDCKALDTVDE